MKSCIASIILSGHLLESNQMYLCDEITINSALVEQLVGRWNDFPMKNSKSILNGIGSLLFDTDSQHSTTRYFSSGFNVFLFSIHNIL